MPAGSRAESATQGVVCEECDYDEPLGYRTAAANREQVRTHLPSVLAIPGARVPGRGPNTSEAASLVRLRRDHDELVHALAIGEVRSARREPLPESLLRECGATIELADRGKWRPDAAAPSIFPRRLCTPRVANRRCTGKPMPGWQGATAGTMLIALRQPPGPAAR